MPAIDPNWLPRVNGAIEGTWHLVLAHSIAHSSGGVWFERGVNREPMLGRQLQHVAIMMSTNVLCAVRVEDGQCIPAFDEIREALVERVIELGDDCPEVVRQLLHVAPEASKASDKTEADAIAEAAAS